MTLPPAVEALGRAAGHRSRDPRLADARRRGAPRRAAAVAAGRAWIRARHRRGGGVVPGGKRTARGCGSRRKTTVAAEVEDERRAPFPVTTCTTLRAALLRRIPQGLHVHRTSAGRRQMPVRDRSPAGNAPGRTSSAANGSCWFDALIGENDEEEEPAPHARTAPLHFCRRCGAAASDGGAPMSLLRSRRRHGSASGHSAKAKSAPGS